MEAIGWVHHYGKDRLLVKIGGQFFQAGMDLENRATSILKGSYLRIQKSKLNVTTRQRYAICDVIQEDEWHKMQAYNQAMMLSCPNGSLNVVDIKLVMVKGKKRKLLLCKDGTVYRLKKSRLEESITSPGFY